MKKKGFTLVELLAVIAILAILVIIALPNIMELFNTSKLNSFKNEIKEVYKTAQTQWMSESMGTSTGKTYAKGTNCPATGELKLSGRGLYYRVVVDSTGTVTSLYVSDGTYYYDDFDFPLSSSSIAEIEADPTALESGKSGRVTCTSTANGYTYTFDYQGQ